MKPLQTAQISKPDYPVRILQFGTGNFLRGFVDWMVQLMNEQLDYQTQVHIIQSHGKEIPSTFVDQQYNYHVLIRGIERGRQIDEVKLVTCIQGMSNPHIDHRSFLDLAHLPELKIIVSNTTEAGIRYQAGDGSPTSPSQLFPGNLTALLYERFVHFEGDETKGLFVLPCELIANNGDMLKACVRNYAQDWNLDPEFSNWLEVAVHFCNTLVDRIVPGFPKEGLQGAQLQFDDKLLVMAEPYHFWAVSCKKSLRTVFPAAEAGLQFVEVDDLEPYRNRKVRILNGAHTAMVPYAYLKGFRTVRAVIEDQTLGKWVIDLLDEEVVPGLANKDASQFAEAVLDRFRNPFIQHELASIALNSISKFRVRVLPSILSYHSLNGKWPERLTDAFAALLLFYKGTWKGEKLPVQDEPAVLSVFDAAWALPTVEETVASLLQAEALWHMDLSVYTDLQEKISLTLKKWE
jgi:tagaturonate reductase